MQARCKLSIPAKALAWLERAYRLRDAGLLGIAGDPMLASLAENAGFKALLSKLMLPS